MFLSKRHRVNGDVVGFPYAALVGNGPAFYLQQQNGFIAVAHHKINFTGKAVVIRYFFMVKDVVLVGQLF